MKSVAVYVRVSSDEQDYNNQMLAIQSFCATQCWQIDAVFSESETAWVSGHQAELARFLKIIESGQKHFGYLVVLALDRLSREGIARMFSLINRIESRGCQVVSMKESWASADNEMRDVFIAIAAWAAKYESQRKSQNTKLGLAKVLKTGITKTGKKIEKLGRPKGSKDIVKRRSSGYHLRYAGKTARESFVSGK
jgi:putative DNA-invertase from lambdoid prophage Rac